MSKSTAQTYEPASIDADGNLRIITED